MGPHPAKEWKKAPLLDTLDPKMSHYHYDVEFVVTILVTACATSLSLSPSRQPEIEAALLALLSSWWCRTMGYEVKYNYGVERLGPSERMKETVLSPWRYSYVTTKWRGSERVARCSVLIVREIVTLLASMHRLCRQCVKKKPLLWAIRPLKEMELETNSNGAKRKGIGLKSSGIAAQREG